MLLTSLSILIVLAVGYAYLREGIFSGFCMFFNTFIAGLVAFNFWEPLADLLDPQLSGMFLQGYEDAICLVALFCATLGLLRTVTNMVSRTEMKYSMLVRQVGGAFFGMGTGYMVAGFLLCTLETLPWHEQFMFFQPNEPRNGLGRILPPDRAWLALMHRAGAFAFANNEDPDPANAEQQSPYAKYITFDKYGNFELRYARYRRYSDAREALTYQGEFEYQLGRTQ